MKSDRVYLSHVLQAIESILKYTEGMTYEDFNSNSLVQDAVIRNFEIIGEATKRVSFQLRNTYPNVPWSKMAGLRDKLIHDYIKVNLVLLWGVVVDVLPLQKIEFQKIISQIN
jgi:uncharacterized protein with HEPN domain